jgi:hypothetical protein
MARQTLNTLVDQIGTLLKSLGPARSYRKMHGIFNALEMQVEDGNYQRHAVARLGEALLATAELYDLREESAQDLEELVCNMVDVVERSR